MSRRGNPGVQDVSDGERVVFLVHGLWRTRFSLLRLELCLRRAGFTVVNRSYQTTKKPLPEHAADLAALVARSLEGRKVREVHFVTHSMGGLVTRYMLTHHDIPHPGRFVMLAPPNHGARKMELFKGVPLLRLFLGPYAASELGQGEDAIFREAGIPSLEFGIIAGGTGGPRGYSLYLDGDNDGTVRVEETRLEGAKDFLLVPHLHTFIMNARAVIDATIRFLETGRFRA